MEKEQKLGMIFNELAEGLNITQTMLEKAEKAYNALGEYIKGANDQWDVVVYPQGSFQLGTVIKPVNDEEQYDVDLVVLVKSPYYDARTLREEVYRILEAHGRYEGKIENKKPCIRIRYADSSQFHMDIASAKESKLSFDESIDIARFNGENIYFYEISNPKLRALMEKNDKRCRFAGKKEIEHCGIVEDKEKYTEDIADHTIKILGETEQYLRRIRRDRGKYSFDIG